MTKKLKVKSVGTAMVPDFEAGDAGIMRFIGRRLDPEKGGFVPVAEPVEVPWRAEYLQAIKSGDLEAADVETAKACGVTIARYAETPKKDSQ